MPGAEKDTKTAPSSASSGGAAASAASSLFVNIGDNEQKALQKQLDAYKAEFKADPKNYQALQKCIDILDNQGRKEEAIAMYRAAYKAEADNMHFILNLVNRLGNSDRQADKDEALLLCKTTLQKQLPDNIKVTLLQNYADILRQQNGSEAKNAALDNYQKALALEPKNFFLMLSIASLHHEMGNTITALEVYKDAHALNPNDPNILLNTGILYRELGLDIAAKKTFDHALEKCPKNLSVYRFICLERGRLHLENKDGNAGNEALLDINNALAGTGEMDPKIYSEMLNVRGKALELLKRNDEALASYQLALRADPTNQNAAAACDRLNNAAQPQSAAAPAPKPK